MRWLPAILLVTVALAGCAQNDGGLVRWEYEPPATEPTQSEPEPEPVPEPVPEPTGPEPVRMLVLGDAGAADEGQFQNLETAALVCADLGCDFAVYLGDNFYPNGVESEYDPLWETHFEQPWAVLDLPVYASQGNHDQSHLIGAGLDTQKGDNEVAYHYRTDRLSEKWQMPARYYDFRAGDVHLFAMDTNVANVAQDDGTQAAWLQQGLDGSNATWKIAFGHHLYSSTSTHGQYSEHHAYVFNSDFMRRWFQDTVCGRADVLLSGHDHILEWMHPRSGCSGTELIISGAGHVGRAKAGDEPTYYSYYDGPGFAWVEVLDDQLNLRYYHAGSTDVQFEKTIQKSEVGSNEYQEDPDEEPLPIPYPLGTSFVAYADGGHDRATQAKNSMAASDVCSTQGCDFVLHVTDRVESEYWPGADRFHFERGAGIVEFFALDTDTDDPAAALAWLREAVEASDATWKVVTGKHPYVANGMPDAAATDPAAQALLQAALCDPGMGIDLYVSGTAHTLEWLAAQPGCLGVGEGPEFIVAGASSKAASIQNVLYPTHFAAGDTVGFWWFHATHDGLLGQAFDMDGDLLFERTLG